MIPQDIWDDQEAFNSLLREHPRSEEQITEFLRDMSLNLHSEIDELMRTTTWKRHRRSSTHRPNRDHRLEELIDTFKLWLTTVQGLEYTPDEIVQAYWRKSMVVRQRHSEEWIKKLDRPSVVIDIDNVLCDYTVGFLEWVLHRYPRFGEAAQRLMVARRFVAGPADLGASEVEWQEMKHEFRSRGHKRFLPTMPGAREFLLWCRGQGYLIILLTSRPIDRYPNLYTDTLWWLKNNELFLQDWLWWSGNKGECLLEHHAAKWVKFVVEDDPRHVEQFLRVGLTVYWMHTTNFGRTLVYEGPSEHRDRLHIVRGLSEIPALVTQTTTGA